MKAMKKASYGDFVDAFTKPTVDWLISNGVETILDVDEIISIVNSASTDYIQVQSSLIRMNFATKSIYHELKVKEEQKKNELEGCYGNLAESIKNDPVRAKLTKDVVDALVKTDGEYLMIHGELQEILSCKQRLYTLSELLNELISVARDVIQNKVNPSPTGRVLTQGEIDGISEKFVELIDAQ